MITSRQNPRIKQLAALQRRKTRRETGLTLAEGPHLVRDALAAGLAIDEVIYAEHVSAECAALVEAARAAGVAVLAVHDDCYSKISTLQSPEGIAAVVRLPSCTLTDLLTPTARVLIADGVQDPGNAGALLRVAEAAGASGCVLLGGAEPDHPRVLRASMGSLFRLPCVACSVEHFLDALRTHPMRLIATALHQDARSYAEVDYTAPVGLILGGEGGGVSAPLLAAADACVQIPMAGGTESLNVAVAAGIVLYEARKVWEGA